MKRITIGIAALALALTGCSAPEADGDSATEFLAVHDLADMSAAEVIDHLDRLPVSERPDDLMASVQNAELVLTDGAQEVAMALPEEKSYVSIAPFVDETHDCFYHSLTTCLGEMSEKPVDVSITDSASGKAVVEESATTFDNGFIGFWVPSDTSGTIEISAAGKTGSTEFSTEDDGATCVTDLQLQ
ncbi:CueP family metal-binding protein [Brevibacterium renqingii]|uniref:CueP family metal-binding protein n=1 Tax=Brevibacterium renqingii TaxID=2776916 RepID=UPI001ADFC26A|nr:CueP family metal-binding protein [Brevibacterium renqingii]